MGYPHKPPPRVTVKDKDEFAAYLRACTDAQVINVHEKERRAGRRIYAALAALEALRRNLPIS